MGYLERIETIMKLRAELATKIHQCDGAISVLTDLNKPEPVIEAEDETPPEEVNSNG